MEHQTAWTETLRTMATSGALFYGVMKLFDAAGDRINEDTRLDIAVWLLDLKTTRKVQGWPGTFAKVFDRVFGNRHLSWSCFARSCVVSIASGLLIWLWLWLEDRKIYDMLYQYFGQYGRYGFLLIPCLFLSNLVPDYLSLLQTRYFLNRQRLTPGKIHAPTLSTRHRGRASHRKRQLRRRRLKPKTTDGSRGSELLRLLFALVITVVLSRLAVFFFTFFAIILGKIDITPLLWPVRRELLKLMALLIGPWVWLIPACFTSIWIWLYVSAGLLLKAARRLDIGFQWFNRHFDIENRPLQRLGLAARTILAAIYLGVTVGRRFL
jgi:hypothetical protein